jgi:ParB family chromosome partitioning protein
MAKRAMGKGLSAILGDEAVKINRATDSGAEKLVGSIALIPIDSITTNPFQPRSNFDSDALVELAQSISEIGIIQPITVRKNGMNFELISGERRFRASQMAGLTEIPAYVRLANDRNMLEMAIVENLQREDLDPIEVAYSCKRMMDELGLTQEAVAQRLGKGRSTVTNFLRLLKLPPIIQAELREFNRNESLDENGESNHASVFSVGHARALLNLPEESQQIELYKRILKDGLSVRQTEKLASELKNPSQKTVKPAKSEAIKSLEVQLNAFFESAVKIDRNEKGQGKIQIAFGSNEQLERIIAKLNG